MRFRRNRGRAKFWGGQVTRIMTGEGKMWWQHFCFIYVFYNDQSPVLRDRVPFASIFSRIYPLDGGVALNNDLRCFRDARMYSHSLSLSLVLHVYTSMKRRSEDPS